MATSSCSKDDEAMRLETCFNNWLTQQQEDLDELLQAGASHRDNPDKLRLLIDKNLNHYEEYRQKRLGRAKSDAPAFLCPAWCTSLENSLLWIGGCRPTLAIRLLYSLTGLEFEARLYSYLNGERKGDLTEITAAQLALVDKLHAKIVKEEKRLSSDMARLQADESLLSIFARELSCRPGGEPDDGLAERGMVVQLEEAMGGVVIEADELRMYTLKELMNILTPLQAVDFLASTRKLHLSLHHWGNKKTR